MPVHGGKLAARALKEAGVEVVFPLSGGHIMPLYDGCIDEGIKIVDVRHEQAAKPVEAIDVAQPGDILVIDAGGVGPAIWGELATNSAIYKGLAGVVIHGALRDSGDIIKLKFPAFTRLIMPNAGEPRGFGEIGVPIRIGNRKVETGDWLLWDDDGVTVLPQKIAVDIRQPGHGRPGKRKSHPGGDQRRPDLSPGDGFIKVVEEGVIINHRK